MGFHLAPQALRGGGKVEILFSDFHFSSAPIESSWFWAFGFRVVEESSSELWECGNLAAFREISIISTTLSGVTEFGCS